MRLSRRHIYAYVALAVVVTAVGVRYLVFSDGGAPAGGERLVLAPAPSPSASATPLAIGGSPAAVAEVVVYVCGAVRSPGVIHLPQGARVADALEFAGGATGKAELAAVNLAARVADGQQIVVPERAASGGGGSTTATPSGAEGSATGGTATALVNINTASLVELETLPGVGPATAQKIVDYRTAQGGFKTIDDLKNVSGIGDARFAAIKDAITV
ncbi:MAG TPA: helix-hairpin-helix domain-containing protein [Thermoleophilia bacterium]|nr:helix-hairpin-helix domain-containing protein [Thermoleophilia bacterium]